MIDDRTIGDNRKIFYDEVKDGMIVTLHIADSGPVFEVDRETRQTRKELQHFRVIGDCAPYTLQAIDSSPEGEEVVRMLLGSWRCR